VKRQITGGQFADAQSSWSDLLDFISTKSGNVVSALTVDPHAIHIYWCMLRLSLKIPQIMLTLKLNSRYRY
jgi:hypothetical protein